MVIVSGDNYLYVAIEMLWDFNMTECSTSLMETNLRACEVLKSSPPTTGISSSLLPDQEN